MSESAVNWSDFETLSKAGINWSDIGTLSTTGINWSEIDVYRPLIPITFYLSNIQ